MNDTKQPKVGFVSLGCPKALVDSERILTQLKTEGYDLVTTYDEADVVVINTCGFINDAVEESMATIGDAMAENGKVIVTGCLGSRDNSILKEYPNVLAVSGAHAYEEVMNAVHQHLPPVHSPLIDLVPPQGIKLTPKHYAYLKISEGCSHQCTFCIIPDLRGNLVSRPLHDVMEEAQRLVDSGVKELLVISQDTSAYGVDARYPTDFWNGQPVKRRMCEMVEQLSRLGIWVRLHYVYPYPHVDEIIPLMSDGLILPYLDIPFQHASPSILKKMKRPALSQKVLNRIQLWRNICPEITLRSTFIVGFPGETDDDFDMLLEFLEDAQLDRVGCFKYSAVDGAKANDLPNHVDEEVKQERFERLMELQNCISQEKLAEKVDSVITVMVDEIREDDDMVIARSQGDAPDIDGLVYLEDVENDGLKPGDNVRVKVIEAGEYDLWAELVDDV